MHKSLVYNYGNVTYYQDSIAYYYKIKPINSLFSNKQNSEDLAEMMFSKISKINMPGQIVIKPNRINSKRIIDYYESAYSKYGIEETKDLKDAYMIDIKKQLAEAVRYRYEIYFIFVQGRLEINKRIFANITKGTSAPPEKYVVEACREGSKLISEQLSGLSIDEINEKEINGLLQYLQIPYDISLNSFYLEPKARYLKYFYNNQKYSEEKEMYSQIFIATKLPFKSDESSDVFNRMQLFDYPIDIIIKFDLEATKKFADEMSAKKNQIDKDSQKHRDMYGYDSVEFQREKMLASIGELAVELGEGCKINFQLLFRIRANTLDTLEKRDKHFRMYMEQCGIDVSYKVGRQEILRNNLIPFDVTFKNNVFSTDLKYFCNFNMLGGLFIGEESEGYILTNTVPGSLPVLHNPLASMLGKTKSTSTTTLVCGESGGGKTQLVNNVSMINMIFFNMKILCIDPKGDRYKLVKQLGDKLSSNLIIGSSESHVGMFDPFIINQDISEALEMAKNDIVLLARSINSNLEINLYDVDMAYDAMMSKVKGKLKKYKRATMMLLAEELVSINKLMGETLLSLSKNKMAKLFFADQENTFSFDLNKRYNLVTFAQVPNLDNFDKNNISHQLFSIILSKTESIIQKFLREDVEPKMLIVDEYKVWKATTQGGNVIESANRIVRSMQTLLFVISQSFNDFEDGMIQSSGQFFVGNLKTESDINKVLSQFTLEDNVNIKDALKDRTKNEGVIEEQKYNFLYVDYNNRKCMTKMRMPDLFKESFDTHLNVDEDEVEYE